MPIPVVDLFAGPGGLSEGFASLETSVGARRFAIRISIEKDPVAHATLALRAFFRCFDKNRVPEQYYDYLRGNVSRSDLLNDRSLRAAVETASREARCAELGKTPHGEIDSWIDAALGRSGEWVLIGGPPCQAYSLAGRARLRPGDPEAFERDHRHFLYTEYLRIIQNFRPSVFVMENVKGMLSSTHGGTSMFERILSDLSSAGAGYVVKSLVADGEVLKPADYVIESERYGLPQCRHRVILFGVRSDLATRVPTQGRFKLCAASRKVTVHDALDGLPPLRSRLSRETDSHRAWLSALEQAPRYLREWRLPARGDIEATMRDAWTEARAYVSPGLPYHGGGVRFAEGAPPCLVSWLHDPRLGGVTQHETRSHMRRDLHRYLFASSFAACQGYSPKLGLFPPMLLPEHGNMAASNIPFIDRFRVQVSSQPSTTVVSHISKDGHYYIHPAPSQCRSLTVREAARLQTFPDNYFFEGNRTQQYAQIGNAVPPMLARQIAETVSDFMQASGR